MTGVDEREVEAGMCDETQYTYLGHIYISGSLQQISLASVFKARQKVRKVKDKRIFECAAEMHYDKVLVTVGWKDGFGWKI
jgi:hypothetical protein